MKDLTRVQKGFFIASVTCFVLSVFFRTALTGYAMTALLFLGGAVYFALFGALLLSDTKAARRLRLALVVFLIGGIACFLAAEIPVWADCHPDEDTSADYLIVCGAGVHGSTPSRSMTDRLAGALVWLEENPDGIAILSGCQGPGEDISEAQAMYTWLTAHDVDPDRLILEEQAEDSLGNLSYSLALIKERGGDPTGRVAILSSEYHLHRLKYIAQRLGCQPVLVAAKTTIFPLFVNYAVREAFGMWKLWVFGM